MLQRRGIETPAEASPFPSRDLPLVVDMDGTLVKTDCLIESVMQLLKTNLLNAFLLPFWMLRGKAYFKHEVFRRTHLDVAHLPYNEELLTYLRAEKEKGRRIILATASTRKVAQPVAEHCGVFSEVLASDRTTNLAGSRKRAALVERFGSRGFVYAGNAAVDLKVWKEAGAAILVRVPRSVSRRLPEDVLVEKAFPWERGWFRPLLRQLRWHQWAKNILIFAPLIITNNWRDAAVVWESILAFIAFSLTASCVYIVNDLIDLEADRLHPDNRRRPFASGDLSLWFSLLSPLLLVGGFAVATAVSMEFLGALVGYFVMTCAYTFYLKRVVIADILVLAGLYAWRVYAGIVATHIMLSSWFLIFAGFLFLSLALVKRCSELILMNKNQKRKNLNRGYSVNDLSQLSMFGTASGYLSVLVLALHFKSPEMEQFYQRPKVLWLMCPFLLYWISRMWLEAQRGNMHTDPLVYTAKDRVSYVLIAFVGAIWCVATGIF